MIHVIDAKDVSPTQTLSTLQYNELKESVRKLAKKTYEMPMGKQGIVVYPIFEQLSIDDDGIITGSLNAQLKAYFLGLREQFTQRSLPEFLSLTSKYSQRLFRFLNSWAKTETEKTVALSDLYEILDAPSSLRKNFNTFSKITLIVAHQEITRATSLCFDWEPIREGLRKVIAVRFIFDVKAAQNREHSKASEDVKITQLQSESNQCYDTFYVLLKKKCKPNKRSQRCQYCTTRGRMFHHERQKLA
jgi:plasmid replication initiation protein